MGNKTEFAAQVGFYVSQGEGWIQPILRKAPWPFGRLHLNATRIRISMPILGDELIPWLAVTRTQSLVLGMQFVFEFERDSAPHELVVSSPLIGRRIQAFLDSFEPTHDESAVN